VSGGAQRAGVWLVIIVLCAAVPAVTSGFTVGLSGPGPWVDDTVLSPGERSEFEARRAALATHATDLIDRMGSCGDLRSLVRESLAGIQQVHAVEVGLVLLTSSPPKMPVTFALALTSGRVVWDRLTVTVPVRPGVVPLGGPAGERAAPPCGPTRR